MLGDLAELADLEEGSGRREVCPSCSRPSANACLCDAMPAEPLRLGAGSRIVVLQHPHEQRR